MKSGSQSKKSSNKFLENQEFSILVDMFNKLQESQNRSLDELAATRKELSDSLKEQKRLSDLIRKKDQELLRLHEQLAIFQKMLFGRKSEKFTSANHQP